MNLAALPLPHRQTPGESRGLKLSFRPSLELITSTRRFLEDLLHTEVADADARSRIVVTIHELIENTYKYSTDGEATLCVTFSALDSGQTRVRVAASNRTQLERARDLEQRIFSLDHLPDPMDAYVRWMTETAQTSGSGLGLLRIRAECEMRLSVARDGEQITIEASTVVPHAESCPAS